MEHDERKTSDPERIQKENIDKLRGIKLILDICFNFV